MASERFVVGVHFTRHRGGPGHLTIEPGVLVLATKRREVKQTSGTVTWEHKRFEPPWGNHWIAVTDGDVTGHAVVGRKRAQQLLALAEAAGFPVERAG